MKVSGASATAAVGVPEITPVLAFELQARPAACPRSSVQVTAPVPPLLLSVAL